MVCGLAADKLLLLLLSRVYKGGRVSNCPMLPVTCLCRVFWELRQHIFLSSNVPCKKQLFQGLLSHYALHIVVSLYMYMYLLLLILISMCVQYTSPYIECLCTRFNSCVQPVSAVIYYYYYYYYYYLPLSFSTCSSLKLVLHLNQSFTSNKSASGLTF